MGNVASSKSIIDTYASITELIGQLNTGADQVEIIRALISRLRTWSGCEAVGIRLRQGLDYPYFETKGFPEEFVRLESRLCSQDSEGNPIVDQNGRPALECLCGIVIEGRYNPELPFFTERGSFWTNSITALVAETTEADWQSTLRHRCKGMGYESIALVLVRFGQTTYGLLQFNDERPGRFTRDHISFLECLADTIALALSRVEKQTALQESEERYRILFQDSHAIKLLIDPETHRIVDANPTACAFYGYDLDAFRALTIERINGLPTDVVHARMAEAQSLSRNRFEFVHRLATGETREVEVATGPLVLKGRRLLYSIVTDITERKQTEQALRENERKFKAIFEGSPDPAVLISWSEARYLDVNEAFLGLTGYARDEVLGKTVHDMHVWVDSRERDQFRQVIADTGRIRDFEARLRVRSGEVVTTLLSAELLEIGQQTCMLSVIKNISGRKKAEESLRRAHEEARAANKTKNEFLANMSHEVRTPLNGVLGMLQLLDDTDQTAEQKEYVHNATIAAHRLARLLSDILDISRIEAGKMKVLVAPFNIKETQLSIKDLFDLEAKSKGLLLKFQCGKDVPPVVLGDEVRVRQILLNLVGNAVKFTAKGSITVETSLQATPTGSTRRVLTTVKDTGIGISDDQLREMFEPFTQGEGSYTRRYQGAGLGLSIVGRLVLLLGGNICIDNTRKGTTFYVSLPFKVPGKGARAAESERVALSPGPAPLRVLIADDDEMSRAIAQRMIEKSGSVAVTAKNGREVLQLLDEGEFDVILMDVQMPVMDGTEATRRIRGSTSLGAKARIPIIAMTAYAMTGDREKFLAAGMDAYIAKPVEKAALLEAIRQVTGASF